MNFYDDVNFLEFCFQKMAIYWLDVELKEKNSILDWNLIPGL